MALAPGISRRIGSVHGFCVLRAAWWRPDLEAQKKWSDQNPLPALRGGSHGSKRLRRALQAALALLAEDGDQPGISRIAAAVEDGPQLLAIIGITATTASITKRQHELITQVRAAARELSARVCIPS